MKRLVSFDRLKNAIAKCREWMNKWRKDDDDWFDHPYAIF